MSSFPPPNYIPTTSAVPGIDIYKPAPEDTGPHQAVVTFNCPRCDGTTAFNTADGGLTCSYCGYHEPPKKPIVGKGAEEFEFTVTTVQRATHGWGVARTDLHCRRCGAHTIIPPDTLTHTCPFCGSNNVIQQKAAQDALRPRYLIPFKLEAEACNKIARQWLGSSWMTPGALRRLARIADFTPVFIPFWTFDSSAFANWKAEVGRTKHTKNGTKTVWRWESGAVKKFFDDLLISGTTRLSKRLLGQIQDYKLKDLIEYEPNFLAGQQAQAYDLPLDSAWRLARDTMREQTREACKKKASTKKIRNFTMNLDFSDESWRYILLPVYIAVYHYRGTRFQVMVNGQTGQIAGQRPADWVKIWLVILAVMSPAFIAGVVGLLLIYFGRAGFPALIIAFILASLGIALSLYLVKQAMELDDA